MSSSFGGFVSNNSLYFNEIRDSLSSIDYIPGTNNQNQVENNPEIQNNNNRNINLENVTEKQKWINFGEDEYGGNVGVRDGDEN